MHHNIDHQGVLQKVHDHFIAKRRKPVLSKQGRPVDIVIQLHGRYCQNPLEAVFGTCDLTSADSRFLRELQDEHDLALKMTAIANAERGTNPDDYFVEELTHRLDRFAAEQGLRSPCTEPELAYTA